MMDIYIDDWRLPVLPDSYTITTGQNNQTVDAVALGAINLKGKRRLNEITFSSFFPLHEGRQGYQRHGSHREAFALCNKFLKKKDDSAVVRLIITETNINGEFLIDEFSFGQQDGSGDVYYTMKLSEYVRPKVAVKNGGKSALYENSRDQKETATETYTVKHGDTLKSIAKAKLGSSDKFTELAALNHISAPYEVKSGQVILLA